MIDTIKKNNYFLLPYFFLLIIGGLLIFFKSKAEIHLLFNQYNHPILNYFFYFITFLGDGLVAFITVIILIVIKYRHALFIALATIFASSITQILKQTLFSDELRPKKFFEGIHELYLVPGVENYSYNSFPSGHSTLAFSLYFGLCLLAKNNTLKCILFLLATLVGFSRIYLSQHFLIDVYVGSIIGVFTTIVFHYFLYIVMYNNKDALLEGSLLNTLNLNKQ